MVWPCLEDELQSFRAPSLHLGADRKIQLRKRTPRGQRKTWLDQLEEGCSRHDMSYIALRQKAKKETKSRFNSFVEEHFLD